jgi:coenzyme F420-reducing hydrogenase delta subunit
MYYDPDSLVGYVTEQMKKINLKTVAIVCRGGSPPPSGKIKEFLEQQGHKDYILLRLPCAGRVSPEFYLKALNKGVEKIIVVQCDEDYCRFKRGSLTNLKRMLFLRKVLEQLGFNENTISYYINSMKAVYVTENCVGCGKCEFVCPYDAITLQPGGTPVIDQALCVGCGACATACPHQAIQIEGFEYDNVSKLIYGYSLAVKKSKVKNGKPSILVFCCQWSEFSALDKVKNGLFDENIAVIEIPCFKGLDPVHVVEALYLGFDGVLAMVCPEDRCKLEKGKEIAEQNAVALEKILEELNLRERFELYRLTPVYINQFEFILREFSNKISSINVRGKRDV